MYVYVCFTIFVQVSEQDQTACTSIKIKWHHLDVFVYTWMFYKKEEINNRSLRLESKIKFQT